MAQKGPNTEKQFPSLTANYTEWTLSWREWHKIKLVTQHQGPAAAVHQTLKTMHLLLTHRTLCSNTIDAKLQLEFSHIEEWASCAGKLFYMAEYRALVRFSVLRQRMLSFQSKYGATFKLKNISHQLIEFQQGIQITTHIIGQKTTYVW